MKAIQKYFMLSAILCCCGAGSFAQRAAYISIDGNTAGIDNLTMQDSVAGNRLFCTASFTLNISDGVDLQKILNSLQVAFFKNTAVGLGISYSRGTSPAFTERKYAAANVLQMTASKLEGSGRSPLKVDVKIRSGQTTETPDVKIKQSSATRTLMSHNFMIEIPGMATNRVAAVSGLELRNNPLVSFEISLADIASWQQWMSNPGKKINGSIFLLAPNMSEKIKVFQLVNMELVSITQSIVSNDERIQRFTAVVRPAMLLLDAAK